MNMKKIIAVISATALSAGILATSAFAKITSDNTIDFTPASDGDYEYAGHIGSLTGNEGNVLAIDVTAQEGTDLSGVRIEFVENLGTFFWFSENAEGTLYTLDGKTVAETEFPAGKPVTVYIDLEKSGVSVVGDFHVHTNAKATGSFKLENVTLMDKSEVPTEDEEEDETPGDDETPGNGNTNEPTDEDDKGATDTGIEGVAIFAGVAVLAAGAFVVAKKRK